MRFSSAGPQLQNVVGNFLGCFVPPSFLFVIFSTPRPQAKQTPPPRGGLDPRRTRGLGKREKKRFMAAAILEKRERELSQRERKRKGQHCSSVVPLASDSLAICHQFPVGRQRCRSSTFVALPFFIVKGKHIFSPNQIFVLRPVVCVVCLCVFSGKPTRHLVYFEIWFLFLYSEKLEICNVF